MQCLATTSYKRTSVFGSQANKRCLPISGTSTENWFHLSLKVRIKDLWARRFIGPPSAIEQPRNIQTENEKMSLHDHHHNKCINTLETLRLLSFTVNGSIWHWGSDCFYVTSHTKLSPPIGNLVLNQPQASDLAHFCHRHYPCLITMM